MMEIWEFIQYWLIEEEWFVVLLVPVGIFLGMLFLDLFHFLAFRQSIFFTKRSDRE